MTFVWRGALEATLRTIAFLALAGLGVHALHAMRSAPKAEATGPELRHALERWSTRDAPERAHVELDEAPDAATRDWLAALRNAGTETSWNGPSPPPTALSVEPVADPRRSKRVWLASPPGSRLVLRDDDGALDSVTVARGGSRVVLPRVGGTLTAAGDGFEATAAIRDSLLLRHVLVLGQAGWEAKFIIAALEEHGWEVEARLAVAPSGDARQRAERVVIDTARYSAIVAVDSVAARYRTQITEYVQAGGGLVAVGEAAGVAALSAVLPAAVIAPATLPGGFTADLAESAPRSPLALTPLGRLEPGALVLETRPPPDGGEDDAIAAVAWRTGDGRVLQLAYLDTWRWRMAGAEDDPVRAHREWWAVLVSSVAHAPRVPLEAPGYLEPTPLASLVALLGGPNARPWTASNPLDHPLIVPVLFAVLILTLLLEWLSRRLRGRA